MWDNTPRQPLYGTSFDNATPEKFQYYLEQKIEEARSFFVGDERLIFINAWNEWAEGAHLEPDQRYGYAYLEATRMALVRKNLLASHCESELSRPVAVVIHAYSDEVLDEIQLGRAACRESESTTV